VRKSHLVSFFFHSRIEITSSVFLCWRFFSVLIRSLISTCGSLIDSQHLCTYRTDSPGKLHNSLCVWPDPINKGQLVITKKYVFSLSISIEIAWRKLKYRNLTKLSFHDQTYVWHTSMAIVTHETQIFFYWSTLQGMRSWEKGTFVIKTNFSTAFFKQFELGWVAFRCNKSSQ